jgi:nicotine blue oxidoreductase
LHGFEHEDTAIVLAAGRGVRMGGPKALMMIGGRAWWRVQRERLRAVGVSDVWVVSAEVLGAMKGESDAPERMVLGDADAPMFASIVAGVLSLRDHPPRGVYLLPVDVPAPALEAWRALGGGASPCVPRWETRRGHPVWLPWGFVERKLLPRARDRDWVMQTRLDRLIAGELVEIAVEGAGVLVNLNTPEDVERWSQSLQP